VVGRELDPGLESFTSLEERTHLYSAILMRLLKFTPERTRVKKEDVYGLVMLFLVGYRWAHATNSNPWIVGSTLLLVVLVMVPIAMALGG
jgi:hypothetical protein